MGFKTEPTGYEKTALSDLQGPWINLRESVVENFGFQDSDKILLHIDEAMSWGSVRNLKHIKEILLIIQNLAMQAESLDEVME